VVPSGVGPWPSFPTFEAAERYARRIVAASARNEYAIHANIEGPGPSATVVLDGNNRVWTEFTEWPA
jgi:hypothetical protein